MADIDVAVIVAAGLSTRIRQLTQGRPKGLLPLAGVSILRRSIAQLHDHGVDEVHVVVGYERHEVIAGTPRAASHVFNPFYAGTNNLASLWFARHAVAGRPFLHLHGDLAYDSEILRRLLSHPAADALVVEQGPADDEAMKVESRDGCFIAASKDLPTERCHGEWIGMTKYSAATAGRLFQQCEWLLEDGRFTDYDAVAMTRLAADGAQLHIVPCNGLPWAEIDDADDYERALELFGAAASLTVAPR